MQAALRTRGGRSAIGFLFVPLLTAIFASTANAGWTAISLHPGGATSSSATGIRLGKASGVVDGNAVVWTGIPGSISMTTLGPGTAYGTDGIEISGIATNTQAAVWNLSPTTYTDLTPSPTPVTNPPAPFFGSVASGVWDGRQAGTAYFANLATHAGYWTESGNSFVDLNDSSVPLTASEAAAVGFDASSSYEEAGFEFSAAQTQLHAYIWHDTAASAQDLNPPTADSSRLFGVSFGKQAGYAIPTGAGAKHAGVWSGTAGSFVDLNPSAPGVTESVASAVYNNGTTVTEAGTTYIGVPEVGHASYWNSTAGSWVDLQSYLPANYTSSSALGIWTTNAGISYITGFAHNSITDQDEAELWVQTLPEPGVMTVGSIAGAMIMRRRSRR